MTEKKLKVLIVGSGGREHTLAWACKQSPLVEEIFVAPGNAGISNLAQCVPLKVNDVEGLCQFAKKQAIDLTIVGPELPLMAGIVNRFQAEGLLVFGPREEAALIEGSKAFAKEIMQKYQIPTARYATFTKLADALTYIEDHPLPLVIKADGLAAGKGVVICQTREEGAVTLQEMLEEERFGNAGKQVVIEEFLDGEEFSLMSFVHGEQVVPMPLAQDHKRIFDGDEGPNTGGMGAYSPVPHIPQAIYDRAVEQIVKPAAQALVSEGRPFTGVLYAGCIWTADGPKVIEFNARFGDPETQVILPRLASDFVQVALATAKGELSSMEITWKEEAALCVVIASQGYPGSYPTGVPIHGLSEAAEQEDVLVFHAGTTRDPATGETLTAGGRVLGVTALGPGMKAAQDRAYEGLKPIQFKGMQYRKDIGWRAIR